MLEVKVPAFSGSFKVSDHENSVPKSIVALMHMILHRSNVKAETIPSQVKALLNISELVMVYNMTTSRSG